MHRFTGLSGVESRNWRKSVANVARSKESFVRTVKFPLESEVLDTIDFQTISSLFDTTEGTRDGSLIGLLAATHLAGFRLFASSGPNQNFRELGHLEQSFRSSWQKQSSIANKLTPSVIIAFAVKDRRKVAGKAKGFDFDTVNKQFGYEIGLSAADRKGESNEVICFARYTERLTEEFKSWADLNKRPEVALKIFDDELRDAGFDLPPLATSLANRIKLSPNKNTIAYDPSLMRPTELSISDFALHQVIAQKFKMLRDDGLDSPGASDLKSAITTENANGLSWLFGVGFTYWQTTNIKQIIEDFQVPDTAKGLVEGLQERFKSVPPDAVFGSPHYAAFRSSVGNKLDSWITNYVSQLLKIEEAIDLFESWRPGDELGTEAGHKFFRSLGITYAELSASIELIEHKKDESKVALNALLGRADHLPTETQILQIEAFSKDISAVNGSLAAIKNAINQDLESDSKSTQKIAQRCDFTIPKWLKPLPRVNQISGGTPDIELELLELGETFRQVRELTDAMVSTALNSARTGGALVGDMDTFILREEHLLRQRKMDGATPETQAKRSLLHRLCGIGKSGSGFLQDTISAELSELFVSQKDLRRLLNNSLGAVYVSPFSTSRHQPLRLSDASLREASPITIIRRVKETVASRVAKERDFSTYRDLLRLEDLVDSIALAALPELVPAAWLPIAKLKDQANIPPAMSPLLEAPALTRQTVIRLRNLLTSQLNGALAKAFRKTFFVRTKFMRVGSNELHWVPKSDRAWTPPKQVETSQGKLGDAIRLVRQRTNNFESSIDVVSAAIAITSELKKDAARGSEISPLLQQLPHDWYLDLKLKGTKSEISGYGVDKERIRRNSEAMSCPARLIGASASKNLIDQWLCSNEVKIGEHNILFEQHYEQIVELDDELNPQFTVTPTSLKAEVALTITDNKVSRTESNPIEETVIGIDLGEAGIGYSVFKTEDIHRAVGQGEEPNPIESGSIPVRSVRDLIARVKRHRKTIQPKQKFHQGASTALEQLREGALGDITYVIDALCAKHSGFPVLETSVANLASGGKQLQLIYDKIVHTYFFSDVDAHKAARRHHWAGAENWEHPSLGETERKQGPDGLWYPTGARRKLKLFPGSAVHPAHTSQICSACRRNPIKAIEDSVADDGGTSFHIRSSRVELASGDELLILSSTDPAKTPTASAIERAKYRRRKERAPNQYPVPDQTVDKRELRRIIQRQLRHGQKSLRSKDTTQSAYSCVFADCGNQMHADENAAINIVRKWVKERGIH